MPLQQIDLATSAKIGLGVKRPEDVAVARDGTVWLADQLSACARVLADGSIERVGRAGGAPNGINIDRQGRIVIANFGGPDDGYGPLQRLDPTTGDVTTVCAAPNSFRLPSAAHTVVTSPVVGSSRCNGP